MNAHSPGKISLLLVWCFLCVGLSVRAQETRVYDVAYYGLKAGSPKNASPLLQKLLDKVKEECREGDSIVIRFHEFPYETGEVILCHARIHLQEFFHRPGQQYHPRHVGSILPDGISDIDFFHNHCTYLNSRYVAPSSSLKLPPMNATRSPDAILPLSRSICMAFLTKASLLFWIGNL